MDIHAKTMSAGFGHSAVINKQGQLFVWGDNSLEQMKPHAEGKNKERSKTI